MSALFVRICQLVNSDVDVKNEGQVALVKIACFKKTEEKKKNLHGVFHFAQREKIEDEKREKRSMIKWQRLRFGKRNVGWVNKLQKEACSAFLLLLLGIFSSRWMNLTNKREENLRASKDKNQIRDSIYTKEITCLINILSCASRSFEELAVEFLAKIFTRLSRHSTLLNQVTFVTNKNHWHLYAYIYLSQHEKNDSKGWTYMIYILNPKNLFSKGRNLIESGIGNYTIHEDKSLSVLHVQISHRSKLFLRNAKKTTKER